MLIYFYFCRNIVAAFGSNLNIDLQQRAVEFGILCRSYDHLRGPILERMPPIPSDRLNKRSTTNGDADNEQNNAEDLLLGDINEQTLGNDHGDSVCCYSAERYLLIVVHFFYDDNLFSECYFGLTWRNGPG